MLAGWVLLPDLAAAQTIAPSAGFAPLPSFAWPQAEAGAPERWTGSFARLSSGFESVSSKRFGGYAGPTLGFEGGRLWQEGRIVYGVVGGFDYLAANVAGGAPGFGHLAYGRDFAGTLHAQVGMLLAPDVLLYAKAGGLAVHEQLRFGATPVSQPFSRDGIAVRSDARLGVEWAITDRLSVSVEAGVTGSGFAR